MPKGSKVLMADDDQMLLGMYKERLELGGYKVTTCDNGEALLHKIHEVNPDVVLLDVMMPKVDGYGTLTSIKSDPQTKNIPVIMLSALMRDMNRQKAAELGANDFLVKSESMPVDVINKIEQVLSKPDQKMGHGTIETHPVGTNAKINLAPITPDLKDLIDPKTPVAKETENKQNSWLTYLIVIIIILGLAGAVYYFFVLRK